MFTHVDGWNKRAPALLVADGDRGNVPFETTDLASASGRPSPSTT